jgi:hypothetical protein
MNYIALIVLFVLTGCGSKSSGNTPELPQVNEVLSDGGIIRGQAVYQIESEQELAAIKFLKNIFMSFAYAASGSSTVVYTNAASVNFSIDVSNLGASGFTGNILNLGSINLSNIDDNNLKICGTGNQKCNQAVIRVYTTGVIAGFVNTADSYGAPLFAGNLNPSTEVGLNIAGAVQTQVISIANNKNRLRMSDFPSPTYGITSNFDNAGAGNYSATVVVEYVLYKL